jgi:hypothetical protein
LSFVPVSWQGQHGVFAVIGGSMRRQTKIESYENRVHARAVVVRGAQIQRLSDVGYRQYCRFALLQQQDESLKKRKQTRPSIQIRYVCRTDRHRPNFIRDWARAPPLARVARSIALHLLFNPIAATLSARCSLPRQSIRQCGGRKNAYETQVSFVVVKQCGGSFLLLLVPTIICWFKPATQLQPSTPD